jgi:hypothetical protein
MALWLTLYFERIVECYRFMMHSVFLKLLNDTNLWLTMHIVSVMWIFYDVMTHCIFCGFGGHLLPSLLP